MDFRFPNTQFYNSDLRELLAMYKQLSEDYSSIKASIEECNDRIENFGDYVNEEIQKGLKIAVANIDTRMSAIEKKFENTYNDLIKLKNDVSDMSGVLYMKIGELEIAIYNLSSELRNEVRNMYDIFNKYRAELDESIESKMNAVIEYINEYITKLERLSVTNPFTGEFVDIQLVLNEIAEYLISGYGLTALEYDNMKITASQYDNLMISAINYSMRGFFMFFEHFYMKIRSPFSGKMDTYANIINELVNLHKKTLRAHTYDNLALTADGYDLIGIDAYHYDWYGEVIAVTT